MQPPLRRAPSPLSSLMPWSPGRGPERPFSGRSPWSGSPLKAFQRSSEGSAEGVGIDTKPGQEELPDDERVPILALIGDDSLHRFAIVGSSIVIGRTASCDVAIGSRLIAPQHVELTPRQEDVLYRTLGAASAEVGGEDRQGEIAIAYRVWTTLAPTFHAAVTRGEQERPETFSDD